MQVLVSLEKVCGLLGEEEEDWKKEKLHSFQFPKLSYQKIPIWFFQVKNCFSNILYACASLLGKPINTSKKNSLLPPKITFQE